VGPALDVGAVSAGAVHSVFARAVNLEIRGDLWTLTGVDQGDLAFGIRVGVRTFDRFGLCRGEQVDVRSGFVGIGSGSRRLVVDCRAAPRWKAAVPDQLVPGLSQRLAVVAGAVRHRCWPETSRLARDVISALQDRDALGIVLADVVGHGPGSTPAGDDVLIGIFAVLRSARAGPAGAGAADSLRRALLPLLPRTTDISGHLLRQAADGLFSRAVHELVAALIGSIAPERMTDKIERVVETGATSGADMCMGLLAAAPEFLRTDDERAAA
jgi:hypothetical protein